MEISELFDRIRDTQDGKGYSGAVSLRDVRVETEDGDLFEIRGIRYDNHLGEFVISVEDTND